MGQAGNTFDKHLVIFHTNDVHSHIPFSSSFFEYLHQAKAQNGLLVDLGDFFEGFSFYNFFEGEPEKRLFLDTYHIAIPGNHGFDVYLELAAKPREEGTKIICANIFSSDQPIFEPVYELEINNLRVGFIGIMSIEAFESIEKEKREGLIVVDPTILLRKYVRRIRKRVDFVVVLSHSGIDQDHRLAQKIKGIDIIFSSHCHSLVYEQDFKNIIVRKARENAKGIGVLKLDSQKITCDELLFEYSDAPFLSKSLRFLNRYKTLFKEQSEQLVTVFSSRLLKEISNRKKLLQYFILLIESKYAAGIYLFNITFLRTCFEKEEVTVNDVFNVIAFDNYITRFCISSGHYEQCLANMPSEMQAQLVIKGNQITSETDLEVITTSYLYQNFFMDYAIGVAVDLELFRAFILNQLIKQYDTYSNTNKKRSGERQDRYISI